MVRHAFVRVSAVLVAVGGLLVLCSADVGVRAAAAADACSLVKTSEAIDVVGASERDIAGPLVVQPGTCSWHSTQSTCTLRSLSVALSTGDAANRLEVLRAAAPEWTAAPEVADDAFFVTDDMPRGAAIFVEHLHLRHGDSLAEVTLVGRVGPDAAHDLLVRVGIDVLASLGGASPT